MSELILGNLALHPFKSNHSRNHLQVHGEGKTEWGTWHFDLISQKLIWSEELQDVFQLERNIGHGLDTYLNLVVEEEREQVRNSLQVAIESGKSLSLIHKVKLTNGEVKTLLSDIKIAYDQAGKPLIVLGLLYDASNSQNLHIQNLKLLNVIKNSLNEIYLFNAETLRFEYINDGALKNSGYQLSELRQKTPLDIKPEFTEEKFRKMIQPLLEGTVKEVVFETKHQRKDQSTYPVEIHLQLMEQGGTNSFLAIALDISERKKQEEMIRKSHDMLEFQNKQLLDFCNIVSHNLRSPLANMSMLVEAIEEAGDEEEMKLYLSKLKPVVGNLHETFNELVDSLQVRQDVEVRAESINLRDYVEKSLDGFEGQVTKLSAIVEIDLQGVEEISCPPKYISSILHNLVSNAFKYRAPDRTPKLSIQAIRKEKSVLIMVKDNGQGIDLKKHQADLFKLRKVFHKHPDAKGFGLFLTKTQVDAMGGKIWAESQPGEGTAFFVELPQ
jgi:PAS domain S-box-containing protein